MGREETGTQDRTETRRRIPCGAGVVQHHSCLSTYSLSVGTLPDTAPGSLQADLQDLCRLIHHNTHGEVSHASTLSLSSVSLSLFLLSSPFSLLSNFSPNVANHSGYRIFRIRTYSLELV